jgi:Mg-chelatase subunit ChlD
MNQNNAIVPGSLAAIAQRNGVGLAESFMSCDVIVLIDQSGSMSQKDAPGGKSRFDAADAELTRIQQNNPGKVGVIAFSSYAVFCPGGMPIRLSGGTNMAEALKFVHVADDTGIKIILISDGEPDSESATLEQARRFKSQINTLYIGPEMGSGREFLQKLAKATGGKSFQAKEPGLLAETVQTLLLGA